MKQKLVLIMLLFFAVEIANAKDVKITASPSDAKIYVDGTYKSDGIYTASFKKKDEFIVIKIEKTGYVPVETKFFYDDKRKTISFTLKEDESILNSVISENANQDFTINVNSKYDAESAWKMLNQVVLTYFDEIKTADKVSGYLQTSWNYRRFPDSKLQVRTRITVKEMAVEHGFAYKVKVSSEIADINTNVEEGFSQWGRILKAYEGFISEIQSRLGGL
jgi:hypothetical protein